MNTQGFPIQNVAIELLKGHSLLLCNRFVFLIFNNLIEVGGIKILIFILQIRKAQKNFLRSCSESVTG